MPRTPLLTDYTTFVIDERFVGIGRGESPWLVMWEQRFRVDKDFDWLKKYEECPTSRVVMSKLTKLEAASLAESERKRLRESGRVLVGERARRSRRRRPLIWNGEMFFTSASEAARCLGMCRETIRRAASNPFDSEWRWAEEK